MIFLPLLQLIVMFPLFTPQAPEQFPHAAQLSWGIAFLQITAATSFVLLSTACVLYLTDFGFSRRSQVTFGLGILLTVAPLLITLIAS